MIIDNIRLYRPNKNDDPDQVHHIHIEEGKISEIKKGRSPEQGVDVYDGDKRTIMPSITDSHLHLLRYGLMKTELDLRGVTSWAELKREVNEYYPYMEEHDWIIGRGLEDDQYSDLDHPLTAKDLEEIHLHKPMFFMHRDGHECVVNQTVLNKLKNEDTFLKKVPEDFIEKNDDGEWNGRFKDTAVHYIKRHFRSRPKDEAKEAIQAAVPFLLENGVTSVHTDDLNFIKDYKILMESYQELEWEGKLPVDVFLHYYIFQKEDLNEFLNAFDIRSGEGSEKVKVGAIKIFLDGTQRLHTAAMRIPYHDKPETAGDVIYSQEELNEIVRVASQNNMQVAMHALGDRATEQAIIALEQPEVNVNKLRHRIIHAQTLGPDLLDRMRDLKPYIEVQPSFLMDEYDEKAKWVGENLAPYCDAFGSLESNQIPYTLSSDAPIGDLNPFVSVFGAVNRTDLNHNPEGGWVPSEKLTIDQAFYAFTYTPRLLEFQEKHKGRLEKGYQADFLLIDQHPKKMHERELHNIKVNEVWVKGKQVYSSD
ncbi:amidohydrolase [Pseudalkalibacillus berkeleyi]|uniref:Amidohydrolase n=1 Tax=Pseudalkalibacillus berkeleyi TaxID=1069813 RepID=A0ABS9GVF0_9BACL|nr:amidohydrolase [Pseudalkalibacillus berkeleyi]MCF6136797.1 amidohydrolase [Pseudalkalibacillus berkeleyi]